MNNKISAITIITTSLVVLTLTGTGCQKIPHVSGPAYGPNAASIFGPSPNNPPGFNVRPTSPPSKLNHPPSPTKNTNPFNIKGPSGPPEQLSRPPTSPPPVKN